MATGRIVTVKYEQVGTWHVFTSDDVRNLFVASHDLMRAYNDVAVSLRKLVLRNEGAEYSFRPRISPDEFLSEHAQSFEVEAQVA
jgi:hypothetical protein